MTPHNKAQKKDISPIVLMPGCPLRAKWIAEHYLTDAILVNDVRNMYAYTGMYKDKKFTVMGSGMGIASAGIYTWELFAKQIYDVDLIIRIGSCGSYTDKIKVGDISIVQSSYSESNYAKQMKLDISGNTIHAKPELVAFAKMVADNQNIKASLQKAHCTDAFYENKPIDEIIKKTNASVVEMETFALFTNAQVHNKNAIALLTCSDCLVSGHDKQLSADEREKQLDEMIKISLEIAYQYNPKQHNNK